MALFCNSWTQLNATNFKWRSVPISLDVLVAKWTGVVTGDLLNYSAPSLSNSIWPQINTSLLTLRQNKPRWLHSNANSKKISQCWKSEEKKLHSKFLLTYFITYIGDHERQKTKASPCDPLASCIGWDHIILENIFLFSMDRLWSGMGCLGNLGRFWTIGQKQRLSSYLVLA